MALRAASPLGQDAHSGCRPPHSGQTSEPSLSSLLRASWSVTVGDADVAAGDAVVSVRSEGEVVEGAGVAAENAAMESSAMLLSGTTGETPFSFFFNLFSCFAALHFPHVMASTRPTSIPLPRAHVLHSL